MDIYCTNKRSDIMSKISGKETIPEIKVRSYLFLKGFRFRKNVKDLPGKPDIVLHKYKTIVFIHGCFWHGHSCKAGKLPQANFEFWNKKIGDNVIRDQKNISTLERIGWKVIVLWQCEIRSPKEKQARLNNLVLEILNR